MNEPHESAISREEPDELLECQPILERLSYFFGAWLGDGYSWYNPLRDSNKWGVGIECMDANIVLRCKDDITTILPMIIEGRIRHYNTKSGTAMTQCRWNSEDMVTLVRYMTNDKEKIPDYIWRATNEARMSMLVGLMDTDGSISVQTRNRETAQLYYRLVFSGKKGFVRQFPDLCRVLGININHHQISPRDGTNNFFLSLPSAIERGFMFHCARKLTRMQEYVRTSYGKKGGRPASRKPSETTRSDEHSS